MIYLIAGVPRAGKTNLSKKLIQELKINCISFDDITLLFETFAPEYGLFNNMDQDKREIIALPLLIKLIKNYVGYRNEDLIIEGDNFNIEYWEKYKLAAKGNIKMVVLGYENISAEEKIKLNSEYSTSENCWFEQLESTEKKIETAEYMINRSKLCKNQTMAINEPEKLKYFNTLDNFDEVLDQCLKFLITD